MLLSPQSGNTGGKTWELIDDIENYDMLWHADFWSWHGFCTHQHTVAIVLTQGLHKIKPIKFPAQMGRGRGLPAWQWTLAVESCWGRESHTSLELWLLVGCPCLRGLGHTQAHIGSTDWTQEVSNNNNNKKKTSNLEGDRVCCTRESWRKVGDRWMW